MTALARFSVNQMTVKQLSMPELVTACRETGVPGVGLWRELVRSYGLDATAKLVHDAGLAVTTLCRGGFLTAIDPGERRRALDDNRAAVDEAAVLGTDTLVLVSGGLPPGSRTCAAPASASPTRSANWARTPPPAACAWPSNRCTRCTRPTAVWCPRWPRPWTSRNASPPSRWASPSTRTTSGGTTRRPPRSPARGRGPHPQLPARRLDHPASRGCPQRPRPARRRLGRLPRVARPGRGGGLHRTHRGRTLQRGAVGQGRARGAGGDGGTVRGARGPMTAGPGLGTRSRTAPAPVPDRTAPVPDRTAPAPVPDPGPRR